MLVNPPAPHPHKQGRPAVGHSRVAYGASLSAPAEPPASPKHTVPLEACSSTEHHQPPPGVVNQTHHEVPLNHQLHKIHTWQAMQSGVDPSSSLALSMSASVRSLCVFLSTPTAAAMSHISKHTPSLQHPSTLCLVVVGG